MNELTYFGSGINLNYIEGPKNGTPLLLVHGNMGRWQAFAPIIPQLTAQHHVFALDLRGHGKSSHAPGTYTLKNHLLDVISFINEKTASPVNLFGMSLGGMIGLMAAAHYPDAIRKVIVADSPLVLETLFPMVEAQKDFGQRIIQLLKTNQKNKVYEELKDDFFFESICACDLDLLETTMNRYQEMFDEYNMDKLFPLIKSPLLIMRGDVKLGSMITDHDMNRAKALLPTLKEKKIADVGHSVLLNKDVVLETVTQFLNDHKQD